MHAALLPLTPSPPVTLLCSPRQLCFCFYVIYADIIPHIPMKSRNHISEEARHVSFWDWLNSLSAISPTCIHFPVSNITCSSLWLERIPLCILPHFLYPWLCFWHPGWFHSSPVMNSAVVNMIHLCDMLTWHPLGNYPEVMHLCCMEDQFLVVFLGGGQCKPPHWFSQWLHRCISV